MTIEAPKLEALMEAAYARWQSNDWDQATFWDQLDADERKAVFVGNLNYQVENGGWMQWFDNQYGTDETVGYLTRLCKTMDTEASREVKELLEAALAIHKDADEEDEDEWLGIQENYDALDRRFYKVNAEFMAEVEATLK